MPNDRSYWLADQIRWLKEEVARLASAPAIQNASSHGGTGWLKIFGKAVSDRPALEFHYTGGGGDLLAQMYQDTGGNIRITGGLQVSGTKNFVMAHPTAPGWVLRHASTESPVNGVEYWGESYIEPAGTVLVKLPPYFEALTKPYNRNVQLTAINIPADMAASRVVEGSFTVTGPPGAEFSWLVKAERATQPGDWPIDFLAEEAGDLAPPPAIVVPAAEPAPAEPAPAEPAPAEPTPTEPAPAEPAPAEPIPAEPTPAEPAPAEPTPAEPTPAEPAPAEPEHRSSPMLDEEWEKRPDRPERPPRVDRTKDPEFAILLPPAEPAPEEPASEEPAPAEPAPEEPAPEEPTP